MDEIKRDQYLKFFPDGARDSRRDAALKEARENRKFEIELYWKRAGYFWLFIAAAFGGYASLRDHQIIAFMIGCSGFLFSLAWYFVNRGSKYWQGNWELHVDLLEDDYAGPIYKTVVQQSKCYFCELDGPYPFSVSKINQLLSLFVTIIWLAPLARTVAIVWDFESIISTRYVVVILGALTLLSALVLFCKGRTANREGNAMIGKFYQRTRLYERSS
jgi:hypothetical protein